MSFPKTYIVYFTQIGCCSLETINLIKTFDCNKNTYSVFNVLFPK